MLPDANRSLRQYRLLEKIGEGGMGEVWKARDDHLHRTVAIKFLKSQFLQDPSYQKRFLTEARAAAAASHPFIASIHEAGECEETLFLVMEYVEGSSLRSLLRQGLSSRQAIRHAVEIAEGLVSAHRSGLVHRDLKPENVIVANDGHVKILDFGLAKWIELGGETASLGSTTAVTLPMDQTATGAILGTPSYMSPEQVRGASVDSRSDVFAFGTMLYELMTGRHPFATGSTPGTLSAILNQEPALPSAHDPAISPELERIIVRCLKKSPEDRYNDTRDLVAQLREFQANWETKSVPVPFGGPAKKRQPWKWLAIGIPALLVVGGAVFTLFEPARNLLVHPPPLNSDKPLLAVLFFENFGSSSQDDMLAAGLTEDIITSLSQIKALRVLSRSAMERYRGQHVDPRDVGRDLGATFVLEGSIRRGDAEALLVTAQLIETRGGEHVWAKRLEAPGGEIYAIQDTIALGIADALRVPVGTEEAKLVSHRWTQNAQAYTYFLLGREKYWDRKSPERCREARLWFEKSLALDPQYAPALAGLSQTHSNERDMEGIVRPDALETALDLARRARSIDPSLGLACRAEGVAYMQLERYQDAALAFEKAIHLNPRVAEAYHSLFDARNALNQWAEAESVGLEGIRVDPYWPASYRTLGWAYVVRGAVPDAQRIVAQGLANLPEHPELLSLRAVIERSQGNKKDAAQLFRSLVEKHPDYFQTYVDLGNLLRDLNQSRAADSTFEAALERWPQVPRVLDRVGSHFMARKEFARSRGFFEKAVRLEPYHFPAWRNLAVCSVQQGRLSEAEHIHKQRIERWPDDPEPVQNLASLYEDQKRAKEAEKIFLDYGRRWPGKLSVLLDVAQFYNRQGRHDVAERWARKGIAANPLDARGHNQLGWESFHLGNAEQAEASFRRAIELNPNSDEGYKGLTLILEGAGRMDDAVGIAEDWVEWKPQNADGWHALGRVHYKNGQISQAVVAYENALALNPDRAGTINNMAIIYGKLHRPAKEREMYERAAALDTTNAIPWFNLAGLLFFEGDDDEARKAALHALTMKQGATDVNSMAMLAQTHALLAQIAQRNGDPDEAERNLATARAGVKKALQDWPKHPEVLRAAAHTYGVSKDREKARKYAELALEFSHDNPDAIYSLACAMALAGDTDRAIQYLQLSVEAGYYDKEVISRDPDLASLNKDPRFLNILKSIR